jgi:glucose/arabinose dehydrogenase
MVLYRGDAFSMLQGDFLITALKTKRLHWVRLKDDKVMINQPVVENLNHRLRDIHVGMDGAVYILTNGERASLLKMLPR